MTEPRSSSKSPGSRWCAILFRTSFSRATKSQAGSSCRPMTARHKHSAWWNESLAARSSSGDRHIRARISRSRSSIRRCALRMTRIGSSVLSRCRRMSSRASLFTVSVGLSIEYGGQHIPVLRLPADEAILGGFQEDVTFFRGPPPGSSSFLVRLRPGVAKGRSRVSGGVA